MHMEANYILKIHSQKIIEIDRVNLAWAFWYSVNNSFMNKVSGSSGMKYSNDQGSSHSESLNNYKKYFDEKFVRRIEHSFIENDDAIKILRSRNVKDAFHYQDPPYINTYQGHYAGYAEEEYLKLLNFNQEECRGKFLLSSYNSDMLQDYIERNGWNKMEISKRLQASNKRNIGKVEVLVWNYNHNEQKKLEL